MTAAQTLRALRLERFSNEMARFIVGAHPEWLKYMKPVPDEEDGLTVYRLSLEFPSENPSLAEPLVVSIDADRVIRVDWFQKRSGKLWNCDWVFYMPNYPRISSWVDSQSGFRSIIEWLELLFAEQQVITFEPPNYGGGMRTADEMRAAGSEAGKVVRSWKGTFDAGQIPT